MKLPCPQRWTRLFCNLLGIWSNERYGVVLSEEDAWAQYRAYSFQTLLTSVVSLGTGSMTDMDDVLAVVLERSVAAIRRTRFADWLDEQVPSGHTL